MSDVSLPGGAAMAGGLERWKLLLAAMFPASTWMHGSEVRCVWVTDREAVMVARALGFSEGEIVDALTWRYARPVIAVDELPRLVDPWVVVVG